jgi:hypothetical protein
LTQCHSLACVRENEDWRALNGQKIRFRQWIPRVKANTGFLGFDARRFVDPVICTVFDTSKNNRLIVDGLHRAYALTQACTQGVDILPTITIIECYGEKVEVIYPCDIHQLPSTEREQQVDV